MHRNYFQKKANSVLLEKINVGKGSFALFMMHWTIFRQRRWNRICIKAHLIKVALRCISSDCKTYNQWSFYGEPVYEPDVLKGTESLGHKIAEKEISGICTKTPWSFLPDSFWIQPWHFLQLLCRERAHGIPCHKQVRETYGNKI